MSYVSHYRPNSHRRPSVRSSRGPKSSKQSINPSLYVKAGAPVETNDYEAHNKFDDFELHQLLKDNIAAKGYVAPSEIQDKTIALGLSGKDVLGISNTGTGKTGAFSIPIINYLITHKDAQALIIAPTRELALQIEEQCKIFAKNSGLAGTLIIGGMPMGRQIQELRRGANIIIGTPGRLKDHIKNGNLRLNNCRMIVLDEVDRMLDMGFINDVRFILDLLPDDRQSFFFSATLSPEVNKLIDGFTKDIVTVNVKAGETSDNVHQDVVAYSNKSERIDLLHDLLLKEDLKKALIFCEMKYGAERLAKELALRGFNADALHGGKSQGQRKRALDSFRTSKINILVATDVAARGIDVADITHVINFDEPHTYNDYVHRIGRAGRAGRIGRALTFVEKKSF